MYCNKKIGKEKNIKRKKYIQYTWDMANKVIKTCDTVQKTYNEINVK